MHETAFWSVVNTLAIRYTDRKLQELINTPQLREILLLGLYDIALPRIVAFLAADENDVAYNNRMRCHYLYALDV